jgi:hypothetical protein
MGATQVALALDNIHLELSRLCQEIDATAAPEEKSASVDASAALPGKPTVPLPCLRFLTGHGST